MDFFTKEDMFFVALVCLFVALSVCLLQNNSNKLWMDFDLTSRICWQWNRWFDFDDYPNHHLNPAIFWRIFYHWDRVIFSICIPTAIINHKIAWHKIQETPTLTSLLCPACGRRPFSGDYKTPSVRAPVRPSVRHVFA